MKKKIIGSLLTVCLLATSISVTSFAQSSVSINQPKPGFVVDYTEYNTAQSTGISPRTTAVLNSWVQRYVNSRNNNYYAKGSVHLVNNANGEDVEHSTTVTLEKDNIVLVTTGKIHGKGDVGGTTGETPTAGTAHVYYDF